MYFDKFVWLFLDRNIIERLGLLILILFVLPVAINAIKLICTRTPVLYNGFISRRTHGVDAGTSSISLTHALNDVVSAMSGANCNRQIITSGTDLKLTQESLMEAIEDTLNDIFKNGLSIDGAFIKFIQIFEQIIHSEKFNDESCKLYGEFIVYFVICVILHRNESCQAFIKRNINALNPTNKYLQLLIDKNINYITNIKNIKCNYCSMKTKEMINCLNVFVNHDHNIATLITSFVHSQMYDFMEMTINFMYLAQSKCDKYRKYVEHVALYNSHNYDLFGYNTIPLILISIKNNIDNNILLFATQILLKLYATADNDRMYCNFSCFLDQFHPIPFHKNPKYWMDLLKMHFNDNQVQISSFLHRFCGFGKIGFILFDIKGMNEYEYIYNELILKHMFFNSEGVLWFVKECLLFSLELYEVQDTNPANYDRKYHSHFISLMLLWCDKPFIIQIIQQLIHKGGYGFHPYDDKFIHKTFVKIKTYYETQTHPNYDILQKLVQFATKNGFIS